MTCHQDSKPLDQMIRALLVACLSVIEHPAAVISETDELIAQNDQWASMTRCALDPSSRLTIRESLHVFADGAALVSAIRAGADNGVTTVTYTPGEIQQGGHSSKKVAVRWYTIQHGATDRKCLLLVIEDAAGCIESLNARISKQQSRIDQLLIRHTLIEENERRRIGRALHDSVAQSLALLRVDLAREASPQQHTANRVALLDRAIEDVRTMSFELGNPILEDLGLLPALHWLAEDIGKRYAAHISVADDAREPPLSSESRTIVFRSVRELTINAAKHAPGSEIVISCVSRGQPSMSILVRDSGPGFDTRGAHLLNGSVDHFGLASVEQQIRGIGGSFKVTSFRGDGTRAVITIPLLTRDRVRV